jgi:hypothetical protein
MSIDQLFQSLEHSLFHISQKIWPPDPAVAWRDEADHIRQELVHRKQILERKREEARTLREAVFKAEVQATILGSQIESWVFNGIQDKAWKQALELDRLRENLHENRMRLSNLESHCRYRAKAIKQLENRQVLLQLKLAGSARSQHIL